MWPAYILLRMRSSLLKFSLIKLPATHHRLLLACFSTSILLMGVNISHAVYLFNNDKFRLAITGHLEVCCVYSSQRRSLHSFFLVYIIGGSISFPLQLARSCYLSLPPLLRPPWIGVRHQSKPHSGAVLPHHLKTQR